MQASNLISLKPKHARLRQKRAPGIGASTIQRSRFDLEDIEARLPELELAAETDNRYAAMTNLGRRLRSLEICLTDASGLVPHSEAWLKYWHREISNYMDDPELRRPKVLFPIEVVRAVMERCTDSAPLVGSIREADE